GMACEGFKPFVAIYSTFLQRAYDQIVHDVAIQKLPLRFAIDRAGLVGADGPTHAGAFDLAYLACLPHFTLMAASDEIELMRMVKTAALIDDAPSAFRYPRGAVRGLEIPKKIEPLEIGKGRVVAEGERVAFLNLGARLAEVEKAAEILRKKNISPSIIDMRFMKPLDSDLLLKLAKTHSVLISIEEGARGGFGAHILQFLAERGVLDGGLVFRPLCLPDRFIDHAAPFDMYGDAKLNAEHIAKTALALI
ncbi:MAG: transketolase C-terminal domain-containing protein, partial [Parvibaculales bacterium]